MFFKSINEEKRIFKKNKSFTIINNKYNNNTFSIPSLSKKNFYKKEENFYYDKSQKEMLLSYIKNAQFDLLNKIDKIENSKEKINLIKKLLMDLKVFLAYLFNEKIRNKDNLQTSVNNNKSRLQNEIKKNYKYDNINHSNNIINKSIIVKSNYKLDEKQKVIDTEMAEKNYIGSEVSKLKLQNFKIENEIIKTDFLIINTKKIIDNIKNTNLFPEENKEIFYYNDIGKDKINQEFNILKNKEKNKLVQIMIKNEEKKIKIEQYNNSINKIKNDINIRNNFSVKNIIYETSLENRITSNS